MHKSSRGFDYFLGFVIVWVAVLLAYFALYLNNQNIQLQREILEAKTETLVYKNLYSETSTRLKQAEKYISCPVQEVVRACVIQK